MVDHVESLICKESFIQFKKRPMNTFHVLKKSSSSSSSSQWISDIPSTMGYQCILSFEQTKTMCDLDHTINNQYTNIPCYHVNDIWTKEQIESIQLSDKSIVLGVPKTLETVDLAVALWRCREFKS